MPEIPLNLRPCFRIKIHSNPPSLDEHPLSNSGLLQMQLMQEMLEIDHRRQQASQLNPSTVDFSLLQTYKEMIQCRRSLLLQISRESASQYH